MWFYHAILILLYVSSNKEIFVEKSFATAPKERCEAFMKNLFDNDFFDTVTGNLRRNRHCIDRIIGEINI